MSMTWQEPADSRPAPSSPRPRKRLTRRQWEDRVLCWLLVLALWTVVLILAAAAFVVTAATLGRLS